MTEDAVLGLLELSVLLSQLGLYSNDDSLVDKGVEALLPIVCNEDPAMLVLYRAAIRLFLEIK